MAALAPALVRRGLRQQNAAVTTRPPTISTDGDVLTADEVSRYHRDGFLAIAALTTGEEVVALRRVYDGLFEPGAIVADGDRVELAGADAGGSGTLPQILSPERYAPELLETVAFGRATALARQLLGPDAEPMGMHAIRKPPHSGAETPWHQDEAYWDPAYDHPALSVWLPLQPATMDNGCMQFAPGSHRGEVVPHDLVNAAEADGLRVRDPREAMRAAVACPIPAGGATVHAARTLHHAGANATDQPRRALIMGFRTAPIPLDRPRDFPWQKASWYA